jgi:regulatory protein
VIRIKPIELPTIPPNGGTITNISFQKQDTNRCSVFLDEEYAFGLHVDIVMQTGIKKGMMLTEEAAKELIDEDVYFKAMKRCLDFITNRPRTKKEIDTRLTQLGVPESVAERVCTRLDELGLINDTEFARLFSESRVRNKGFGFMRIKQELIHKGVAPELAEAAVKQAYPEEEQAKQLSVQLELAQRKYRKETDLRAKNHKITQHLMRRGFNSGQIMDVIRSQEK